MLFILYFTRQDIKKNFLFTVTAWASARRHLQGGRRERGQTKNQDQKKNHPYPSTTNPYSNPKPNFNPDPDLYLNHQRSHGWA